MPAENVTVLPVGVAPELDEDELVPPAPEVLLLDDDEVVPVPATQVFAALHVSPPLHPPP